MSDMFELTSHLSQEKTNGKFFLLRYLFPSFKLSSLGYSRLRLHQEHRTLLRLSLTFILINSLIGLFP